MFIEFGETVSDARTNEIFCRPHYYPYNNVRLTLCAIGSLDAATIAAQSLNKTLVNARLTPRY